MFLPCQQQALSTHSQTSPDKKRSQIENRIRKQAHDDGWGHHEAWLLLPPFRLPKFKLPNLENRPRKDPNDPILPI